MIDRQLVGIACAREGFRLGYPAAGSNIDTDVAFHTAQDIVTYLPRALQIGVLAPFPASWLELGKARQPGGSVQRLLVIPEMVVYYVALTGILLLFLNSEPRQKVVAITVVSFAVSIVLIYALVVTNVGTLYRMRYPSMLLLFAIGSWGWSRLWIRRTRAFLRTKNPSERQGAQAAVRRH